MRFPDSIQKLIDLFSTLPTVGPKTAERFVFSLLKKDQNYLNNFSVALKNLKEKITLCSNCLSISENNPCLICTDSKRDKEVLCIAADSRDLIPLEGTHQYNGLYFVLGGVINTIEGIGPEQINIKRLVERIKNHSIKEIIIALNPDLEGETTSLYLNKLIKQIKPSIKITRLAKGLPMGASLEYADELTLGNALKYRNEL